MSDSPAPDLLRAVALGMPTTADLSRSDLLLVRPTGAQRLVVVAQARPRSISALHDEDLVGRVLAAGDASLIVDAWRTRRRVGAQFELPSGAPVMQDVRPVIDANRRMIGLLSFETSLLQVERHRHRHVSFRRAMDWLRWMCVRGEMAGAAGLSPFEEMDGLLMADAQLRITYLSGIANNLYRRLGYVEDLRGQKLSHLHTADAELALAAMQARQPLEREILEDNRVWIRKVLPIWPPSTLRGWAENRLTAGGWMQRTLLYRPGENELGGVLIALHDATDERLKKAELEVKSTMIQEVHHRVKNNLQNVAAVLRMQARRATEPETQQAIKEAISRILSVAVIHEFLSLDETQSINIREVCQRIVSQTRQVMTPGKQIEMTVTGPAIHLPAQQATACALIVNELVANALEHGYEESRTEGAIQIELTDGGDTVQLEVCDDGTPLPDDFAIGGTASLGLQIVQSLVQSDLRGQLKLDNQDRGVVATVRFPKSVIGGASVAR